VNSSGSSGHLSLQTARQVIKRMPRAPDIRLALRYPGLRIRMQSCWGEHIVGARTVRYGWWSNQQKSAAAYFPARRRDGQPDVVTALNSAAQERSISFRDGAGESSGLSTLAFGLMKLVPIGRIPDRRRQPFAPSTPASFPAHFAAEYLTPGADRNGVLLLGHASARSPSALRQFQGPAGENR